MKTIASLALICLSVACVSARRTHVRAAHLGFRGGFAFGDILEAFPNGNAALVGAITQEIVKYQSSDLATQTTNVAQDLKARKIDFFLADALFDLVSGTGETLPLASGSKALEAAMTEAGYEKIYESVAVTYPAPRVDTSTGQPDLQSTLREYQQVYKRMDSNLIIKNSKVIPLTKIQPSEKDFPGIQHGQSNMLSLNVAYRGGQTVKVLLPAAPLDCICGQTGELNAKIIKRVIKDTSIPILLVGELASTRLEKPNENYQRNSIFRHLMSLDYATELYSGSHQNSKYFTRTDTNSKDATVLTSRTSHALVFFGPRSRCKIANFQANYGTGLGIAQQGNAAGIRCRKNKRKN